MKFMKMCAAAALAAGLAGCGESVTVTYKADDPEALGVTVGQCVVKALKEGKADTVKDVLSEALGKVWADECKAELGKFADGFAKMLEGAWSDDKFKETVKALDLGAISAELVVEGEQYRTGSIWQSLLLKAPAEGDLAIGRRIVKVKVNGGDFDIPGVVVKKFGDSWKVLYIPGPM